MSHPPAWQDLLARFVDDRDSLSEAELGELVTALQQQPELLAQLRDQLQFDDLLSQQGTLDRRNFAAQMEQRVADYLRGEDELNQQTEELRAMALARVRESAGEKPSNRNMLFAWTTALSLLLGVGFGLAMWQRQEADARLVRVDELFGKVVIRRANTSDQYAQTRMPLQPGDRVLVQHDAALVLKYSDGTRVRVEGNTEINLPAKPTAGKELFVDTGEVSAKVAKQPTGQPMIFVTPHADAIVRGTELYLQVQNRHTQLEVTEGQVELIERKMRDAQLVNATESAVATTGSKVAKKAIPWPTSREGLGYLFAGSKRPALARFGSVLSRTQIAPLGAGANWNALGQMEIRGGAFADRTAAPALQAWLKSTQGFSLEIVLTTQTPKLPEAQKIWALESESHTLCALVQREGELVWVYDLPRPWQTWNAAHAIPMGSLTPEEGSLHFHITFDGHNHWQTWKENIPADNATPKRTHQSFTHEPAALGSNVPQRICFGSDAEQESRWQGEIAGLALYNRAITAEEITTSYTRFGKKD